MGEQEWRSGESIHVPPIIFVIFHNSFNFPAEKIRTVVPIVMYRLSRA